MVAEADPLRLYYDWAHALPEGEEKNRALWTLLNSLIIELANMRRERSITKLQEGSLRPE